MKGFFKDQSPLRIIAFGFLAMIILGSVLLILPISIKNGVTFSYIDSLFTATSAVCVTGLATVDPGSTFTVFGQVVLALLIQIGGLGVSTLGAGIILAMGMKIDLKGRDLLKESMNSSNGGEIVKLLKSALFITIGVELCGAVLGFIVFIGDNPLPRALGLSAFHAISSFNNAGFDIFGMGSSLEPYSDNILLNVTTMMLIIVGGIGFLVIRDVWKHKFKVRKYSMHTKVVLSMTATLIAVGTLLLMITDDVTFLEALFTSVSTRTAGFATHRIGDFSNAGLLVMIALMIIGASPGSTGGGIKTTTAFVLFKGVLGSATNKSEKAFRYAIPRDAFKKAAVIFVMAIMIICASTFTVSILEPHLALSDVLYEMASAYATVGLSTGITASLSTASKIVTIILMYIGRLGPLTIASLWYFSRGERIRFPDGNIAIG